MSTKRHRFAGCWRKDGVNRGRCCVIGAGVSVAVLVSRFAVGDSIYTLSRDYHVPRWQIEDALRLALSAAKGLTGDKHEARMAELLRQHGREQPGRTDR